MNVITDNFNALTKSMNNSLSILHSNKNLNALVSLALLLYAALLAPALPNVVIQFFDTVPGKLIFVFVIAYISGKNIEFALILSVVFVLLLTLANQRRMEEGFDVSMNLIAEGDGTGATVPVDGMDGPAGLEGPEGSEGSEGTDGSEELADGSESDEEDEEDDEADKEDDEAVADGQEEEEGIVGLGGIGENTSPGLIDGDGFANPESTVVPAHNTSGDNSLMYAPF